MSDVTAMVQTGPRTFEQRYIERPAVRQDDAIVRVEAVGICGSDVEFYEASPAFFQGRRPAEYPVIRGHEPVGVIEEIGDAAAWQRGMKVGDRVAVDPFMPCGTCRFCLLGDPVLCTGWGNRAHTYGSIPLDVEPGLWGGFATHLFVTPRTVLHEVPARIPAERATLFNPLGAGIWWGVDLAETTIGTTIAILGCGQRGLACAIAARQAGASFVLVTGLAADRHKMDLALDLGVVDMTVNVDDADAVEAVMKTTDSVGVDVVVDATSRATEPIMDAIRMVRGGGRLVLGGLKGRNMHDFPVDLLVRKSLTVRGVRGIRSDAYRRAIELIASDTYPLDRLRTHVYPLDEVETAIRVLAGAAPNERALNVVVTP